MPWIAAPQLSISAEFFPSRFEGRNGMLKTSTAPIAHSPKNQPKRDISPGFLVVARWKLQFASGAQPYRSAAEVQQQGSKRQKHSARDSQVDWLHGGARTKPRW